ncbi:MAG: hypothetical protein U1E13_11300, partial [Methylophilaceae bacterium]|nr:hypothetical protein [Methylophilaceae bacterium]
MNSDVGMTASSEKDIDGRFLIYSGAQQSSADPQFRLSASWAITLSDDLRLIKVNNRDHLIGWLLGVVVDLDIGIVVSDSLVIEVAPT